MAFKKTSYLPLLTISCIINTAEASIGLGYTGGLVTPTADVQEFGKISLGASNFLSPYYIKRERRLEPREAENYFIGLGVYPGLEIFGGLSEVHRSGADPNAYLDLDKRDLVGNVKWQAFNNGNSRIAFGIHDAAGMVVKERRYYGVASHNFNLFDISIGYAELPEETENQNMFSGVFSNTKIPLHYGISLYAEYDGHSLRQGLGGSWKLSDSGIQLDTKAIVNSNYSHEGTSVYIGIQIPLIRPNGIKLYNDESINSSNTEQPAKNNTTHTTPITIDPTNINATPKMKIEDSKSNTTKCGSLLSLNENENEIKKLSRILSTQGLGNVSVNCEGESLQVSLSNRLFLSGEPEAFVVASQILQDYLKSKKYRGLISLRVHSDTTWDIGANLNMTDNRLNLLNVKYLKKDSSFNTSILSSNNASNALIDLSVSPVYRANYGSEVGILDTSIGARLAIKTQPWKNAWVSYKYDIPLYNSHHYQKNGFFEDRALRAGTHEISLSQRWYINQLSSVELIGGIREISNNDYEFKGGTGTIHSPTGAHSLYAKAIQYNPYKNDLLAREVMTGGYRWLIPEKNFAISYEGGKYFHGDLSDKIKATFFLDKTTFETTFTKSSYGWDKVGAILRMPFGNKKKHQLNRVTIGGIPSWSPSIYTTTANPHGIEQNLTNGYAGYIDTGLTPSAGISKARTLEHEGRWSPAYIKTLYKRMMNY